MCDVRVRVYDWRRTRVAYECIHCSVHYVVVQHCTYITLRSVLIQQVGRLGPGGTCAPHPRPRPNRAYS